MRNMPLDTDVDRVELAAVTHGFVGADLEYLCKEERRIKCLRRLLPELNLEEEKLGPETLEKLVITMSDFEGALKDVMPSAMREVYLNPLMSNGQTSVGLKKSNVNYRKQWNGH